MLSFQARKKEDNYLLPVYNYMSGGSAPKSTMQTPTQSSSKYMSSPTSRYLPKTSTVQKPIYPAYQQTQNLMRQSSSYQTPTATKPPVKPPVVPPPTNIPVPQPTSPLTKLQQIGANRQTFLQKQAEDEAARQKGILDIRSKTLQAQVPELEGRLNKYRDLSREAIAGQEAITAGEKERIRQESGEEMRLNAQTAREGRGRIQSTLAGLNALDSSSTGQLLAKAEGNLANNQATALRGQKQQLAEADQNLTIYKQQARLAEDDEIAKFNQAIREISANYDINSLEYQNAVKQAYDKAQEEIYKIEQGVAQAELDVQSIYEKAYAEQDAKNMAGGGSDNQGKALQMVNNLLKGNTQAISGGFRTPGFLAPLVPGAGAARADYEGLKNLLALAKRGELKGSGAVSDFEAKMLEKAAMAGLTAELPEQEFVARLKQLQSDLMSGGAVDTRSQMVTMQSPDGQTYQVDQSEVQEATANGWRAI